MVNHLPAESHGRTFLCHRWCATRWGRLGLWVEISWAVFDLVGALLKCGRTANWARVVVAKGSLLLVPCLPHVPSLPRSLVLEVAAGQGCGDSVLCLLTWNVAATDVCLISSLLNEVLIKSEKSYSAAGLVSVACFLSYGSSEKPNRTGRYHVAARS